MREGVDYHRILDGPNAIFMGPLPASWEDVPAPVVINATAIYPPGPPKTQLLFAFPLLDLQESSALPPRDRLERLLEAVDAQARQRATYWHCHAGLNRSGLLLAAYLHLHRGHRISDAISLLRERRLPIVLCNALFERTLRSWYGGPDEQDFDAVDVSAWMRARTGGRAGWR